MTQIYLVEIGGMRADTVFEAHEVHVVVAADDQDLVDQCRMRLHDRLDRAHIDGWLAFAAVAAGPQPHPVATRCHMIELGRNSQVALREQHDYRMIMASGAREAIAQAREAAPDWHVDAVVDLDQLAADRGLCLVRDHPAATPQARQKSCYIKIA